MPTARKPSLSSLQRRLESNAGLPFKARYQRRQPEQTHLYQLVERYYPEFRDLMTNQGRRLPDYVQEEFEIFLKCGRLEHGFLRVKCGACQHERLVAFSCNI